MQADCFQKNFSAACAIVLHILCGVAVKKCGQSVTKLAAYSQFTYDTHYRYWYVRFEYWTSE